MTQYEMLQRLATKKNGKVINRALRELLNTGVAVTGKSSKNGKSVYTCKVSSFLTQNKISHVCENTAPRGGAAGERVRLTGNISRVVAFEQKKRRAEFEKNLIANVKLIEEQKKQYEEECNSTYNRLANSCISFDFSNIKELNRNVFHNLAISVNCQNNNGFKKYVTEQFNYNH